ncbi:MAG: EF-hand domain-containing protein [Gammaproteobacteria bacterium]|nr:EF-hand domain-containing protein [Gammaproteobacteria bacterium]
MNRKYLIVLASLAFLSPAVAEMEFGEVDSNNDGFVSAEESVMIPRLRDVIGEFDEDEDGKLSEEEFTDYTDSVEPPDQGG